MTTEQPGVIGKVIADEGVESFLRAMAAKWDASRKTAAWWQIWKSVPITEATNFLLNAIDELVNYVDTTIANNLDKKATVMDAMNRLYDYIIAEALPFWLKPFSPAIKAIVMDHIVSPAIDWVVSKYRAGSWNANTTQQAQLFGVPGNHRP